MKKILSLLLAVAMTGVMFAGCTSKKTITINSAEDLNGLQIGVQAGTTGETWVGDNVVDTEASKTKTLSYKSGMDAAIELSNGTIDAVVLDELPAKAIIEQNKDLKILDFSLTSEEYAIAVKKGNTELVDAINATITTMKDDGSYDELVKAFMPTDGEIKVPTPLELIGEETIKMGTNAAFKPFEYVEGADIVGFDITMSENVAKSMGQQLEIVNMEFGSLINALTAGTIDFAAAGMTATDERRKSVDFSQPYYSASQVIIVRK